MAAKKKGTQGSKEQQPKAPRSLTELKDPVKIGVTCAYVVQKLGEAYQSDIKKVLAERLGVKIHTARMTKALEALQKRGLISINNDYHPDTGKAQKRYSMKNMIWKQPPEYAFFEEFLPRLLATEEAQQLNDYFGGVSKGGPGKKGRRPDIGEYHRFYAKVITTNALLGSQVRSQAQDAVREKWRIENVVDTKKKDDDSGIEGAGIWHIDDLTGMHVIPQDVLQGWAKSNMMRFGDVSGTRATYVAFAPVYFTPHAMYEEVLPVQSQQGAAAPKPYEAVAAGQILELHFTAPTKGALSPEQWERLFIEAGLNPIRGLSPARGRRFGHFVPIEFRDLGSIKSRGAAQHLLSLVPQAILEKHGSYLKEAVKRLSKVTLPGAPGEPAARVDPVPPMPGNGAGARR